MGAANGGSGGPAVWSHQHDLVVSSFPHNNLGKDFRFNLRLLMSIKTTGGEDPETSGFRADPTGKQFFSYYFYKINKIQIDFPFNVAYALYHENPEIKQQLLVLVLTIVLQPRVNGGKHSIRMPTIILP